MWFIWRVLKSYPVQWVTQWRCHPSTLLLTCVWWWGNKQSLLLEKCFYFHCLVLMLQKSITNLCKSSRFNVRRHRNLFQNSEFLASVPATIKHIGWGDRVETGVIHISTSRALAQLLEIRAQPHHLAQHRKQAGRDLLSLHIQRMRHQTKTHTTTAQELSMGFIRSRCTCATPRQIPQWTKQQSDYRIFISPGIHEGNKKLKQQNSSKICSVSKC